MKKLMRIFYASILICGLQFQAQAFGAQIEDQNKKGEQQIVATQVTLYAFDLQEYEHEILPAIVSFRTDGRIDQLVTLLERAYRESANVSGPEYAPRIEYIEQMKLLERAAKNEHNVLRATIKWGKTVRPIQEFVSYTVMPSLVSSLCIMRNNGRVLKQDLSRSPLVPYLCNHSSWIMRLLTFEEIAAGGTLEFPIGESSEMLTAEQTIRFQEELRLIPRPDWDEQLMNEYDNVSTLVHFSLDTPSAVILIVVF